MTFWELATADKAATRANWDHTAALSAIIANTVRDSRKRKQPFTAADFHPMREVVYDGEPDDLGELKEALKSWQVNPAR